MNQKELFYIDYKKARPNIKNIRIRDIIKCHEIGYLFFSRRLAGAKNRIAKRILLKIVLSYRKKYGLELNMNNIGGGLLLVHPWDITVHNDVRIGNNATLFKGVTIGVIAHGNKKGVPTIGDNCIVYANATVCGNINIGNNVIISAGAFVNFDVPDNSIVIGNPGIIHRMN